MKNNIKKIEQFHTEQFLTNLGIKPDGLLPLKNDPPDFSLQIDNRFISIEHTRLINPKMKEKEEYKDKIIKEAQKRFENKHNEKIYALITFQQVDLEGKHRFEEYVLGVLDVIEQIYLNNKNFEFFISSKLNSFGVSDLIESITINNKDNFSHWQHFNSFLVPEVDINHFQNLISKKEKRIDAYSNQFDENWLLIVGELGTEASTYTFHQMNFSEIHSKFDKIYLYSHTPGGITVVK